MYCKDAKEKITNALEKPHEIIEMTVKQKDRNELLATFERQRLEYENKKKRDLEEIQEEMAEKEANWEQNAKNWKREMKKMTDQLKVLLINKYKWISNIYIIIKKWLRKMF